MTQPAQQQQDQLIGVEEIFRRIEEKSGVSPDSVPTGQRYQWFAKKLFVVGKEAPINASYLVVAIFDDDDEVRVYAMQTAVAAAKSVARPPNRYKLAKNAELLFVDQMNLDVFIDEMAAEMVALADLDGGEEDDDGEDEEDEGDPDAPGEVEVASGEVAAGPIAAEVVP